MTGERSVSTRKALIAKNLSDGPVVIGDWYWVPSLPIVHCKKKFVPILPTLHADEGQAREHYNLDQRFLTRRQRYYSLGPSVQTVFLPTGSPPVLALHQCTRSVPHIKDYYDGDLYKMIERGCSDGRTMTDMRCPHRGVDLTSCPVVDGIVTCPAHGMRWRVSDGSMVTQEAKSATTRPVYTHGLAVGAEDDLPVNHSLNALKCFAWAKALPEVGDKNFSVMTRAGKPVCGFHNNNNRDPAIILKAPNWA